MAKLYPPSIDGKLPACDSESLIIPFTMNKSVGMAEVGGMSAVVKTISTGKEIGRVDGQLSRDAASGKYYANFNIKSLNLNLGQFYKV